MSQLIHSHMRDESSQLTQDGVGLGVAVLCTVQTAAAALHGRARAKPHTDEVAAGGARQHLSVPKATLPHGHVLAEALEQQAARMSGATHHDHIVEHNPQLMQRGPGAAIEHGPVLHSTFQASWGGVAGACGFTSCRASKSPQIPCQRCQNHAAASPELRHRQREGKWAGAQ